MRIDIMGGLRSIGTTALLAMAWTWPGASQTVRELQIAPAQVEVRAGERKSVLVTAFDATGNVVTSAAFTWTVDNPSVRVSRDEATPNILYIEGVNAGSVGLSVSSGGVTATASIRVLASGAAGPSGSGVATILRIDPPTVHLLPTEERQIQLVFLKEDGSLAARSPATWRSLLETVAAVDDRGAVVGITPGQGVIEAQASGGLTARALVQVENAALGFPSPTLSLPPLASDTVRVIVPSQEGRRVPNRAFRWATTNPAVVNVSPLGVVTAIAVGQAQIVVQGFGQQIQLPVTVHPPIEYMYPSPPQGEITVPRGGSVSLSVRFETAGNTPVEGDLARWAVEDTSVARFDPSVGRIVGVASGTTRVTVRGPAPGLEAAWTVRVASGRLALAPARFGLGRGSSTVLAPGFVGEDGVDLGTVDAVEWTTLDASVATVDAEGRVTGVAWGVTGVVGTTAWGEADTAAVFVQGEVLVTSTRTGAGDLYALDRDAPGTLHRVTSGAGSEVAGSYSRDGSRIAYVSTEDDNPEVYVANADGSNPVRLTTTPETEGWPRWTPDGRLVYVVTSGTGANLWVMGADGAGAAPLTEGRHVRDQPAVSPDGTAIAYRSTEASGRKVFVIAIDGSAPRQVTQDDRAAGSPAWLPDGRLAYVVQRPAGRRGMVGVVEAADLSTGVTETLTPDSISVADVAVSSDGALLALVVQGEENGVIVQRLFLWPVGTTEGAAVEVPRAAIGEMFLYPAFRP